MHTSSSRDFLRELLKGEMCTGKREITSVFANIFRSVLDKHAPIKTKKIGNQSPFMSIVLSNAIMKKSKIQSKYLKWRSRENLQ